MWIELSKEEAETITIALGQLRRAREDGLYTRFTAIVAAGDEPRVLDTDGKVVSSNRLWDYSTEDDILEIADQNNVKLTPSQLDKLVRDIYHDDLWSDRVEDALNKLEAVQ